MVYLHAKNLYTLIIYINNLLIYSLYNICLVYIFRQFFRLFCNMLKKSKCINLFFNFRIIVYAFRLSIDIQF